MEKNNNNQSMNKRNEKHVIFAMEYCKLCPLSPSSRPPFELEPYI